MPHYRWPASETAVALLRQSLITVAPARCLHCSDLSQEADWLCSECRSVVTEPHAACQRCGLPITRTLPDKRGCEHCRASPPAFTTTIAPLRYTPPVRTLVTRWKFKGHTGLTRYLIELAGAERFIASDTPDVIVPVPPHWRRHFTRGFDQTWLLANSIAHRHPERPPVHSLLRRARSTAEQKRLSSRERILNMRDAFMIKRPVRASHVALVDDVVTTGATVSACAETLRAAGVARVDIWCLVRVANPDEEL